MKKMGLTTKIFVGMTLGIIFGLIMFKVPAGYVKDKVILDGILAFVGSGFIRLLMMVLVPVVFTSLACGTASLDDITTLGRIGTKTLAYYMATTVLAICIALVLALFINPGVGVNAGDIQLAAPKIAENVPLVDVFLNIIPRNFFDALTTANMLQIILFAVFTGLAISVAKAKAEWPRKLIEQWNEVFLAMTTMIMAFAPYGVFALTTRTFAKLGYSAMLPLAKYMIAIGIALLIQAIFVYGGMLKVFTGLSYTRFIKNMIPVITVIFSTASSAATLPVNLETVQKMGVSKRVASFTIPLGATINMDGTAIMQGVASIFIAQMFNVELSVMSYATIIITATLASIGTAGIPGSGLIMLTMVLTAVGLPVEGIAMIMGVDRLVDMCRSTINILGDAVCTLIIAKQENEFDKAAFYADNAENA